MFSSPVLSSNFILLLKSAYGEGLLSSSEIQEAHSESGVARVISENSSKDPFVCYRFARVQTKL